jgi:hypothetical protein
MYIIYASETAMLISVCIVCEQTNSSLSGGGRPARSGLCFTEPSKKGREWEGDAQQKNAHVVSAQAVANEGAVAV